MLQVTNAYADYCKYPEYILASILSTGQVFMNTAIRTLWQVSLVGWDMKQCKGQVSDLR